MSLLRFGENPSFKNLLEILTPTGEHEDDLNYDKFTEEFPRRA
jgi:hypothetical protein